ncbi:hypothetical protein BSP239C_03911 [Brevibacterium sp. 239c]|nr:hypothetical protein BSP239C_03911 [Brevibacterium sp. 239c]
MRYPVAAIPMAISTALAVGVSAACVSEFSEVRSVSCSSYAQDPDVEALVDESAAVVVGNFSETGESSAKTHVKEVFKGAVNSGETITVEWVTGCGEPTDFLNEAPEENDEFVYFLDKQGEQYVLVDGSYGMFNASSTLLEEVSIATGEQWD